MTPESFAKYSVASKARWARWTPEVRSAKMREIANKKWAQVSPEDRLKHAMKMVEARKKK